ncbi:MAG: AIR synthase-related protein, partial [Propionibacteriaceae bacterium]
AEVLARASKRGLLSSAHDLSEGGLAQALVESSLRRGFGATVDLPAGLDPFVALFSESTGRVIVSVKDDAEGDLAGLCAEAGVPVVRLGTVTAAGPDATLAVAGQFTLDLAELRAAWQAPIPAAMGV